MYIFLDFSDTVKFSNISSFCSSDKFPLFSISNCSIINCSLGVIFLFVFFISANFSDAFIKPPKRLILSIQTSASTVPFGILNSIVGNLLILITCGSMFVKLIPLNLLFSNILRFVLNVAKSSSVDKLTVPVFNVFIKSFDIGKAYGSTPFRGIVPSSFEIIYKICSVLDHSSNKFLYASTLFK